MSKTRQFAGVILALIASAFAISGCATNRNPESRMLRLARDADVAYQTGDLNAAKRKYKMLLEDNPKNATAHVRLGAIAYREGDAVTAREQFEIAARKDPKNAQAKYNLAMLSLNDAAQVLNDYVALTPQPPKRDRVLVLLSQLREFEGK